MKQSDVYASLLMSMVLLFLVQANNTQADVLAERDQHTLTNQHISHMIEAGEQIAESNFTQEEQQKLQQWAIQLFQQAPDLQAVQRAFNQYQHYAKLAKQTHEPAYKRLIWQHLYREMAFKWQFPHYSNHSITLWDVIQRYNPIMRKNTTHSLIQTQKDPLIHQHGDYFLTQSLLTALQISTEFLAQQALTAQEQSDLFTWAKADFAKTAANSSQAYAYMLDHIAPNALAPSSKATQAAFRYETYRQYYFAFQQDSFAQQWEHHMMALVQRHNPPILIDNKQQVAISQHEIDDRVSVALFFKHAFGLPDTDLASLKQQEKQSILQQYQQGYTQPLFSTNTPFLLRSQEYWQHLEKHQQHQLTRQIRKNYQQVPQLWSALAPLFNELQAIIQAEQHQKQTQQQLARTRLTQLLQHNQQTQARLLNSVQQSNQWMLDNLRDRTTQLSIHLADQKIIGERGNYYIVKDQRGRRFEIAR